MRESCLVIALHHNNVSACCIYGDCVDHDLGEMAIVALLATHIYELCNRNRNVQTDIHNWLDQR